MVSIRASRPEDGDRAVTIWRAAVDATHFFLTPEDRDAIDEQVQQFLPQLPLWLAVDEKDRAVGFMSLSESHMGALFIDPAYRGLGVGRALVEHALKFHPTITTDVNEQNEQAVGFYGQLGFIRTGRSPIDGQGRPYPLVHLRLETKG
jgi:putative acetyltransferase